MQNRLAELERLVLTLMPEPSMRGTITPASNLPISPQAGIAAMHTTESPQFSTPKEDRSEAGSMRFSASEQRYVGGEHWMAIVDSIAELKEHIDREEQLAMVDTEHFSGEAEDDEGGELTTGSHALLLYGCEPAATREEILSALPPKGAVDRYIARYFNFQELVSGKSRSRWLHCRVPSCGCWADTRGILCSIERPVS